ncbi:MAG: GWxTD domain-containing protein [Bacteroidota bacterium]
MKSKLLPVLCLLTFLQMESFAQNELNFEFDYARFKYDSTSAYIEFYYELNPKNMLFETTDQGRLVQAIVHIEMKNISSDTYLINKDWKIQNMYDDSTSEADIKSLTGVFGFVVPEGDYALSVKAYDVKNPSLLKTIDERVVVSSYNSGKYAVSDIQIASNIKKEDADPNSLFYKNTLEVIPNPSMLYSDKTPVAFFYAELYNLKLPDPQNAFTLQKLLYNSAGNSVYKQEKIIKQCETSVVEIGLINLSKFPTDSYNIVLSLIDNKTNEAFISTKRFYLYNPNVVDSAAIKRVSAGVMGSEFALYNDEECDNMFSQVKYISSQNEIERYGKLDSLNAKREFLFNFWLNRDTEPSTPQNEFKDEYIRRVAYANDNFKHANKEGYLSDRGRVYLTYGQPDQRDFYPNEPNLKPYEVWFYNQIEGGVSFIFADVTGFGNYELLHSTKRGDVRDENWMRRISTE